MTGESGLDRIAPVSYEQEGLWFSEQFYQQAGLLNVSRCYLLRGSLSINALRDAISLLVGRHETLRTTFGLADDGVIQRIHSRLDPGFDVVDLSGMTGDTVSHCRKLASMDSVRGFDLDAGPLVRIRLYRLSGSAHIFLFTLHHLLCDRWSFDVLFRDLTELYQASLRGTEPALPPLPRQYADYAIAQREALRGAYADELVSYWSQTVADGSPSLELPGGRRRQGRRESLGAAVTARLSPELADAVTRMAREERVTPFTVYLAAFRVLLWRHTGQRDQLIGVPMTERDQPDLEQLVGFLTNMLVIRNRLSGGRAGFRDVLLAERDAVLDAFEHSELPHAKLVETLRPVREMSASPLFSVSFSYHPGSIADPVWPTLRVEPFPVGMEVSQLDLVLEVVRDDAGASVSWAFNDDIYPDETIARLAERFPLMLKAIVANLDQPVGDLPILSEKDIAQLRELRSTQTGAADDDVVDLFDAWATRTPHATAVRQNELTRSYAETASVSHAVAVRLANLGLAPEMRVGLLLRRTADLPAIILGVLRAGLAAVPIDPAYPAERIGAVLADAEAGVLVHDGCPSELSGRWQALTIEELCGAPAENFGGRVCGGDRLAYVLYTSGSTGSPKGVAITHGGLANCLLTTREALGYRPGERWLAVSRTAFDISLLELLTPLVSGGEVIVTTDEQGRDGAALRDLLRLYQPDYMLATPGLWQMLYDSGWRGAAGLTVLTGGDVTSPALAGRLIRDNAVFWHAYGPTEGTLYCVATILTEVDEHQILPLGRPIRQMSVQLLDEDLRPVPPGVIGELCIAGPGVARGYINKPDVTAERFIPDPWASVPGSRLYRTGDLALLRPDGRLELRGRNDRQVKLRGHRIELGEIENVLSSHPEVGGSVVLCVGNSAETSGLVAFMQAPPDTDVASVRDHLQRRIPRFMVPSSYYVMPRIPITANGKVDRAALVAIANADTGSGRAAERVPPRPGMEATIAGIWVGLLGLAEVSRDDDFFALGGNSLLAARAAATMREKLGVELSVWTMFEAPTAAELAAQLTSASDVRGRHSSLGWLRGSQPVPLLALAPPAGGSILCYRELTGLLSSGVNVCAFNGTGMADAGSIEELAARYVSRLPAGWRPGRVVLGGWSIGGLIGYEMAVQLARCGGPAPPVLLVDTQILDDRSFTADEALDIFVADVAGLIGVSADDLPRDIDALARAVDIEVAELSERFSIMRDNARRAASYTPPPYAGTVHFVLPRQRPEAAASRWRSLAGSMSVTVVPGDHYTAIRGQGASLIAALIDDIDALRPKAAA